MGFSDPVGVVALEAGTEVTTKAGSVTTNTQAQQSAVDAAVIQGLLPSGVSYATATGRASGTAALELGANVTANLLPPDASAQLIIKLLVLGGNVAGMQRAIAEQRTAGGVHVGYVAYSFVNFGNGPLILPYGAGLAMARGNTLTVTTPGLAGAYGAFVAYDVVTF